MPDTDCSRCCNNAELFRDIPVFGATVRVKDYICSADGVHYQKKAEPGRLQLSVNIGAYCPCACPFCIAKHTKTKRHIDIDRFAEVLSGLQAQHMIRGVKITGGEPFYDVELLSDAIALIYEICGADAEVSVSTNGMYLDKMHRIRDLAKLEALHVSRHHYDDERNRALFGGGEALSGAALKEILHTVSYRDLFVLNCMLLKEGVSTPAQAHRMLDFAAETGAPKVGFFECAPANAYCRAQFVGFEDVLRADDPQLLFTRGFFDYGWCRCKDGVYLAPTGELIEFYGRTTAPYTPAYSRGLVYDTDDHLYDGYGGRLIL